MVCVCDPMMLLFAEMIKYPEHVWQYVDELIEELTQDHQPHKVVPLGVYIDAPTRPLHVPAMSDGQVLPSTPNATVRERVECIEATFRCNREASSVCNMGISPPMRVTVGIIPSDASSSVEITNGSTLVHDDLWSGGSFSTHASLDEFVPVPYDPLPLSMSSISVQLDSPRVFGRYCLII